MRKGLEDIKHMVRDVPYPFLLPDGLRAYHYYIADAGHCIMCVLKCHLNEAKDDMDSYEIPVPVRYVLETGYKIVDGYVIIEAKYDSAFGLDVDEKYYEY